MISELFPVVFFKYVMRLRSLRLFLMLLPICFFCLPLLCPILPRRLALPLLVCRSLEDPHLLLEALVLNLILLHLACFVLNQQVFDVGLPLSLGFSVPGMQFVLELVNLFLGHFISLKLFLDIKLIRHLLIEVEF